MIIRTLKELEREVEAERLDLTYNPPSPPPVARAIGQACIDRGYFRDL